MKYIGELPESEAKRYNCKSFTETRRSKSGRMVNYYDCWTHDNEDIDWDRLSKARVNQLDRQLRIKFDFTEIRKLSK